jgi:hypothetical protein
MGRAHRQAGSVLGVVSGTGGSFVAIERAMRS